MKLIRSIIPFILIACLLLTFSACSGGDDGSQSSAVSEDGKQTVQKYVDEVAKANGASIKINSFVRFETGEGLEKKNEDFAAEVAAQASK